MNSFSLETKKGTEETIEAISRTVEWASRIDTRNDAEEIDVSGFVEELREEKERLEEKHKVKTTEREVDNFVVNQESLVEDILLGTLDEKVDALDELEEYVGDSFGYVKPLSLSKEEWIWLVSSEVKKQRESNFGPDEYDSEMYDIGLDEMGQRPDRWEEGYPLY